MRSSTAVLLVLLILWTVLFAYLTLQNGDETEITGNSVAAVLARVFNLDTRTVHRFLRSAAHVISFLVETLLLALLLSSAGADKAWLWSMMVCLVLSLVAEAVKIPIPGRHFAWSDVGLNVAGVITGTLIGLVV